MWIDSHCHLNHDKLKELGTPTEIIKAANDAGVEGMLTICCRVSDEFPEILNITQNHKNIWCSVGTHPHEASSDAEKAVSVADIVKLANSDPNIVGIGETGLDYFYDSATREDQDVSFRKNLRASIETNLPVIVHSRDAEAETMRLIKEEGTGTNLKGVMHCFSSKAILAEEALDFDFHISFAGIITFKKAQELRDIAKTVPLNRILVETDSPYLAPEPYRGRTNQPAYVTRTGAVLAEVYNISEEELANHSKQNFFNLFSKAKLA